MLDATLDANTQKVYGIFVINQRQMQDHLRVQDRHYLVLNKDKKCFKILAVWLKIKRDKPISILLTSSKE